MRNNLLSRVKSIAASCEIWGFHSIPAKYSSVLSIYKLKQAAQENSFLGPLDTEVESSTIFRNVGTYLLVDTASYARRFDCSSPGQAQYSIPSEFYAVFCLNQQYFTISFSLQTLLTHY
jgi:hypothetical protein